MGCVIFFFASAGASAAYLTASEVFPMETRALCIAFFYAIGTAAGGIAGPLLFGKLIDDATAGGEGISAIALGYYIGAALMVAGGHRRGVPRRQGRGRVAREHRQAADGGGGRRPPGGGPQRPPPQPRLTGRRRHTSQPRPPTKVGGTDPDLLRRLVR